MFVHNQTASVQDLSAIFAFGQLLHHYVLTVLPRKTPIARPKQGCYVCSSHITAGAKR